MHSEAQQRFHMVYSLCKAVRSPLTGKDRTDPMEAAFPEEALAAAINANEREDGRSLRNVRRPKVEAGVVSRSHGSALARAGSASAIASATLQRASSASPSLSVHCDPEPTQGNARGRAARSASELDTRIRSALLHSSFISESELLANDDSPLLVTVNIQLLSADGSATTTALAAACGALKDARAPRDELLQPQTSGNNGDTNMHAGNEFKNDDELTRLPIHDESGFPKVLVVGVHGQGQLVLDPTASEQNLLNAVIEVVCKGDGSLVSTRAMCGPRALADREVVSACSAAASMPQSRFIGRSESSAP